MKRKTPISDGFDRGVVTIINKSLNNRLMALESLYKRDRIIVLAELPDGTRRSMTVDEMIEEQAGFCKVLSGCDLSDLDKILDSIASHSVIE